MKNNQYSIQGFTMIEVLVAMTLLSIIIVILFGILRTSTGLWEKSEKTVRLAAVRTTAKNFFSNTLSNAKLMPIPEKENDGQPGEKEILFLGDHDRLSFVSDMPTASPMQGLYIYTLSHQTSGDKSIMVNLVPYYKTSSPVSIDAEILDQVEGLEFSYFGALSDNDELKWHEAWAGASKLPSLVQVKLIGHNESETQSLIVPIHVTVKAGN